MTFLIFFENKLFFADFLQFSMKEGFRNRNALRHSLCAQRSDFDDPRDETFQVQIMTTGFLGIGHVSSNWSCSQESSSPLNISSRGSSSQNLNRENELDNYSIGTFYFMGRLRKDVLQSVSNFQVRTGT